MKLEAFGRTNVGNKRQHNEDAFLLDEALGLFLVADGCGDTETAPTLLSIIASYLNETNLSAEDWPLHVPHTTGASQRLTSAVKLANEEATKLKSMTAMRSMAAMAGLLLVGDSAFVTHVGDCRVYRLRNERLEQLTEDHTLLNDFLKLGKLLPEEVENFPHRNVIVRALGAKRDLQVDVALIHPKAGDIFLLCTDGLYNDVKEEQMKKIVQGASSLEVACAELLRTADENRGSDNATVILVRR